MRKGEKEGRGGPGLGSRVPRLRLEITRQVEERRERGARTGHSGSAAFIMHVFSFVCFGFEILYLLCIYLFYIEKRLHSRSENVDVSQEISMVVGQMLPYRCYQLFMAFMINALFLQRF